MKFATTLGFVGVGDIVRFSTDKGIKQGTVTSGKFYDGNLSFEVYSEDATGSYKSTIQHDQIQDIMSREALKKPERYNKRGSLECWDVILDQEMNFLEGSVLKYLWRYKEKNGVQDLEKAKVYIDKLISEMDKK